MSAFCRERPLGVSVRKSFSEQTERPHCRTGPGTEPRPKRDSVGPTNMFGVCEVPLGECFLQREAVGDSFKKERRTGGIGKPS